MARKLPAFIILCFLLSHFACARQNTGSPATSATTQANVVGSVKNVQTGKPLEDVHVQLLHLPSTDSQGVDLVYGAMSKTNGSFSIAGVKPGSYLLGFDHYGFELASAQKAFSKFLTIHPGEQVNLDVGMVASATISGEVLDEYGDPLANMNLLAERLDDKRLTSTRESRQTSTDDRGQFRLLVPPGNYRIKTQFLGGVGSGLPEKRTDGTQPGRYPEVYFPGTPSAAAAAVIEARAGEERSGITFRLNSSPFYSISGALSNFPANANCSLSVHSGPTADSMRSGSTAQFLQEPDGKFGGKFLLGNLDPGFYQISAYCRSGGDILFSQNESIDLTRASAEGVALRISPGVEVIGILAPRRLWQPSTTPHISLQSGDSLVGFMLPGADVASDGSFTIKNVPPGRYGVVVEPLPENAYIQTVHDNGGALPKKVFDVSETGAKLKVVVSDQGAEISGVVRNAKADVAPFVGHVFLQPAGQKFKTEGAISTRVDGQGKYTLKAVPPGSYRLFAVSFEMFGSDDTDDVINSAAHSGELLVVPAGARITKDLKVPTGDANATQ